MKKNRQVTIFTIVTLLCASLYGMDEVIISKVDIANIILANDESVKLDAEQFESLQAIIDEEDGVEFKSVTIAAFNFIIKNLDILKNDKSSERWAMLRELLPSTKLYSEVLDAAGFLNISEILRIHECIYECSLNPWHEEDKVEQEYFIKIFEYRRESGSHKKIPTLDSLDTQDEDGWTPLMRAIVSCDYDRVKQLVDAGACCTLANKKGQTALLIAEEYRKNTTDPCKKENFEAMIQLLPSHI